MVFVEEDVIESSVGNNQSISFSPHVMEHLIKPWQNIVVELLGRQIGYRALSTRLESLWSSTRGFPIIDLENDYYLVHFKSEGDA